MKKLIYTLLIVFALGLVFSGCATPPKEDMDKAEAAVTRAENDVDAVNYAPNALLRAREALNKMNSEANAKRYDAAKNYAAEAIANAEKAISDGKAGAARAREEAVSLLNSLAGPLSDTANSLNAARNVKGIQLDFNALSTDLGRANGTYDDARRSLQGNDYKDAVAKGQNVRSILADINSRISNATIATSRKQ